MPILRDKYSEKEIRDILFNLNQVARELVQVHCVQAIVEHDRIPYLGQIQPPDRIIVNIQKHRDMVYAVRTVYHEYCHLLQYARLNQSGAVADINRDIHKFYKIEFREYCNLDFGIPLEYLIYWCCPFETEARVFAKNEGTVDTGHLLLSVNLSDIRSVYQKFGLGQEILVSEYRQLDFVLRTQIAEIRQDHKKWAAQFFSQVDPKFVLSA